MLENHPMFSLTSEDGQGIENAHRSSMVELVHDKCLPGPWIDESIGGTDPTLTYPER